MPLVKLPLASTWDLAAGLEAVDNAIRLAVGSGLWDANSLDFTETPPSPWVLSEGGAGNIAEILDAQRMHMLTPLVANFMFWRLLAPNWTANVTDSDEGVSMHFILSTSVNNTPFTGVVMGIDDGTKNFEVRSSPDGSWRDQDSVNYKGAGYEYGWVEMYIAIQNNSMAVYEKNLITGLWELTVSGIVGGASGANRLIFGDLTTGTIGEAYYDRMFFRQSFQALPFVTSAPVAEMAAPVAVAESIDQIDIDESLGDANANIRYQYDIGAGYNGSWITLAALQTALVGTSPATLRVKSQFNSNGLSQATMGVNGTQSVLAGTSTCDFPIEANVLDGIEYDNGDLTGTLKKYSVDTNPNDTKRKRILDVLDTRLKAISTDLGYKTDLGDNVFRWRVTEMNPFDPEEELPGVNYVDDDQRPEQSSHGPETVEHSMQVMLHVYATTEAELRSARADIVEAIGADVGFSTLAQDAQLIDDGSDTAHEQDKIWSTEMFLQIMYTTGRWDPYE